MCFLLTVDMPHPVLQLGCSCPRLTCLGMAKHSTRPMLLLLLALIPSGQSVLSISLHCGGDGCKLLHHAVAPVSPLDRVCRVIGLADSTISTAQHLHLLVQQVLAE